MATSIQILTAEDLERVPDDGFHYELVGGELRRMAPSGYTHGKVVVRLTWRLAQYVEGRGLGAVAAAETGFLISSNPDTVRAPDVAFISRQRLEAVGEVEGYWPGAPDLAVEVVSPSDTYAGVKEKVADWLAAGTRMVAVVDPRQRRVTVYRSLTEVLVLNQDDTLNGGEVVPGWTMPVSELFS